MAAAAALTTVSFTKIHSFTFTFTYSSSSHTPLHSFTHFSPKPTKPPLFKTTLTFKPHFFTLLSPLHVCHSSYALGDTGDAAFDQEQDTDGVLESEVDENDEFDVGEVKDKGSNANVNGNGNDIGRVYVGNLPFNMTSSQLSEIFSQAGHVESVEIMYDKMTDRSRGFGFVTMKSVDEAREVIRMFDGSQVGGRTVRVNFPEVPKGGERKVMGPNIRISNQSFVDTPHKIYAGNLGWGVTTQGLRDAFAEQPGFLSARVVYERESGRSRGFGFISFSSPEAAQSALVAMNGMELEGRPLRLNVAAERSRPNSRDDVGQSEVSSINS